MKIALSTSVIQRGKSGVGQYVLSLVRALLPHAARHDFSLYVLEDDLPLFAFADGPMRLVPVPERHRPAVKNILWHQTIFPALLRRAGTDVVHVPSYRRMLWPRPCALVSTIHDLAPFHLAKKYDRARMFYGRIVARQLARRQDRIIAVSSLTAREIERHFGLGSDRVEVIHNGIDHSAFKPGTQSVARENVCRLRGLERPFFLYVARLEHPAKNHVRLIQAFDAFKESTGSSWQLVLGGSDWHGAEVVHQAVEQAAYTRDIHRLGFVSNDDLPDWYRAADVFVFPTLYEGFGLPPLEAMASGCPVLASRRGAVAEVLGDAAGTLEPEDVAQMASQLTRIATDAAWRRDLRTAGLVRARDYDWDNAAAATLQVYSRALAAPAASRAPALLWG